MTARRLFVLAVTLLLAIQVVRTNAVALLSAPRPATAARLWPGHPQVEISEGMNEIAQAVRQRANVGQATFAMLDDAAVKSPLSPEPFLVHGVRARLAGDEQAAMWAFRQAQWRDPRSVPAAYFLAEYYLRSGHVLEGLRQIALIARLMPVSQAISPFVAQYAQNPATWPQMRAFFRTEQSIEDGVLTSLAQDPRNADAILALADAKHRKPDSVWLPGLLRGLIAKGDYAKARMIWSSVGRAQPNSDLLYDPEFSAPAAPPPFNWKLESSTVGLAERQPGKRLHVLFYGNRDGILASELVLLAPGTYRLQMQLVGSPVHPELLSWSVRCDKSREPVSTVGISEARARGWTFEVPGNCPAQWIALSGRSADVAQQADATIGGLSLRRVGAHAQ